jgi:hypothetical protein
MYLCEEYMLRNSIKIPYVKLTGYGSSFFKKNDFWNILTISWKEPINHPGRFIIKIMEPRHNGCETEGLFNVLEKHEIYLDEYENFFLNWASNFSGKIARDDEVYIAAWEIYLHCYDCLLVKYAKMEELLATIDQEASISDRLNSINKTILKFSDLYPYIIDSWSINIQRYIDNYNHWLPLLMDYYAQQNHR